MAMAIDSSTESLFTGSIKPDISGYPDAFEESDGEHYPLFSANDIIWVERQSTLFPGNWFETRKLRVLDVNQEEKLIVGWDDLTEEHCLTHWESGLARGNVYKIFQRDGVKTEKKVAKQKVTEPQTRTEKLPTLSASGKRRVRPPGSNNKIKPSTPPKVAAVEGIKRGRGRPPGSKNKPKG